MGALRWLCVHDLTCSRAPILPVGATWIIPIMSLVAVRLMHVGAFTHSQAQGWALIRSQGCPGTKPTWALASSTPCFLGRSSGVLWVDGEKKKKEFKKTQQDLMVHCGMVQNLACVQLMRLLVWTGTAGRRKACKRKLCLYTCNNAAKN